MNLRALSNPPAHLTLDRRESKSQSGVSLLELLLSTSVLLLLAVVALPLSTRFLGSSNYLGTIDQVVSLLHSAQSNAQASKGSGLWGVCLVNGSDVRLFSDSCATPSYKIDFPVPNGVTVSNLSSVIFNNTLGEPQAATTITISAGQSSSSITINAAGGILRE